MWNYISGTHRGDKRILMHRSTVKLWAYIILFTILGITGNVLAKLVEYQAFSQYTCNFVYGVVITIFALENWTLLMDINQCNRNLQDRESHMNVIKNLTETNHTLVQRNIHLKNEIMRINTADRERGDEAIKCIINWRYAWDTRSNLSDGSPAMSCIDDIKKTKNTDIKLPSAIWDSDSNLSDESPAMSYTEDIKKTKNKETKSPGMARFHKTPSKIPPITQEDSL